MWNVNLALTILRIQHTNAEHSLQNMWIDGASAGRRTPAVRLRRLAVRRGAGAASTNRCCEEEAGSLEVVPAARPGRASRATCPPSNGSTTAIAASARRLSKAIVGQERVLEELLIAIFARGHCLLVGVPGLAKTLMIRTLADSLSLSFSRVQFTPDLMPSDITGTEVLQEDKTTGQRLFKFLHGPLFANVVLADEINRTPPKTQAALLEAMQERQVTVGGTRHKLPDPFFVLATQNPIEQEGTYPLPEAQQDRFMFNILVDYPEEEEEFSIVEMTTSTHVPKIDRVLSATDILEMQDIVRKVPVAPYVIRYAMKFTRLTRKGSRVASDETTPERRRASRRQSKCPTSSAITSPGGPARGRRSS